MLEKSFRIYLSSNSEKALKAKARRIQPGFFMEKRA
jgi:hypothetical protein